jgi:hypothetical protein
LKTKVSGFEYKYRFPEHLFAWITPVNAPSPFLTNKYRQRVYWIVESR